MAVKQVEHINIYTEIGDDAVAVAELSGSAATSFMQGYQSYVANGLPKAGVINPGDSDTFTRRYIQFRCICQVDKLPNTQEDIDDPVCNDIPCPPDRVTPPPAE